MKNILITLKGPGLWIILAFEHHI